MGIFENIVYLLQNNQDIMLSILIPTYNFICTRLVQDLWQQSKNLSPQIPFEILVADDASSNRGTILANRSINDLENCTFFELEKNVGRASIRNLLAEKAKFKYLLFIDSDAKICRDDFIAKYLQAAKERIIVCGGIQNVSEIPSSQYYLRYIYEESACKIRTIRYRDAHPYAQFSSFNFLIPKKIFQTFRFDERCTKYGYEDALFGYRLKEANIKILHIDNPLIHNGIDTNMEFLKKTEVSLQTLQSLGEEAYKYAHIAHVLKQIEKLRICFLLRLWHKIFGRIERGILLGKRPTIFLLQLYKLGYLSSLPPLKKSCGK